MSKIQAGLLFAVVGLMTLVVFGAIHYEPILSPMPDLPDVGTTEPAMEIRSSPPEAPKATPPDQDQTLISRSPAHHEPLSQGTG